MCIEALYDFATHLSIEDMFNNRKEWHNTAKNIQRQFKGYEKMRSASTPYDIQQCGRDNIEDFLKHVNPALAILIREKILIEWRKRHGRGKSKPKRRKRKRYKRRKGIFEVRPHNEDEENKIDEPPTEEIIEEDKFDVKQNTIGTRYSRRSNYEFAGWVRRLSTVITKALEFRFSETKRKKRNAIIVKTHREQFPLKIGTLDATFVREESLEDDTTGNINDSDDEVSVYEEIVSPIAPRGSFWGTQDPIPCVVRTKSKVSKKESINIDVNDDNMSEITNSPKSICFSIPNVGMSPTPLDEEYTDSDDEYRLEDDISSTNTMDHIATRRYTRKYTEDFCSNVISMVLKQVVDRRITSYQNKYAHSKSVHNHKNGIPETNDVDHGHVELLTDITDEVRIQPVSNNYREEFPHRDSDPSLNIEDYWIEYIQAATKHSDNHDSVERDDDEKFTINNCNVVLDLPSKPMIVQLGNRLQTTTIYDTPTQQQRNIRVSPKDKTYPFEREQKMTVMDKKTNGFAFNYSIKDSPTPVSIDQADDISMNSPPEILITQKQRSSTRSDLTKKSLLKAPHVVRIINQKEESKEKRHNKSTKLRPSTDSDSLQSHRFTFSDVGTSNWCTQHTNKVTLEPHEPTQTRPTQRLSPFRHSSMTAKHIPIESLKISSRVLEKEICPQHDIPLQQRQSCSEKKSFSKKRYHQINRTLIRLNNTQCSNNSSKEGQTTTLMNEDVKDRGKGLSSVTVEDILEKFNVGN